MCLLFLFFSMIYQGKEILTFGQGESLLYLLLKSMVMGAGRGRCLLTKKTWCYLYKKKTWIWSPAIHCSNKHGGIIWTLDSTITPVAEFIDPRFRENRGSPKTLAFSHRKRAFWACFRENCVCNFGHRGRKWWPYWTRRSKTKRESFEL